MLAETSRAFDQAEQPFSQASRLKGVRRRALLGRAMAAAAAVALTSCGVEQSRQTPKRIPRLGYMAGPSSSDVVKQLLEAFRGGLRDHGYVEGETVQLELRYCACKADGQTALEWDAFASEFVRSPVDVIVMGADPPTPQIAARATTTIPIVAMMTEDPVASGLADSLARPGRNVTGITKIPGVIHGKRLELLREIAPGIRRVGAIRDLGTPVGRAALEGAQETARVLGIELVELIIQNTQGSVTGALGVATKHEVDALLVGPVPFFIQEGASEIVAYALERRIPLASSGVGKWVEAGGLIAFDDDLFASQRRLTYFVDRILKGAKPGDLPLEQPSKFETILNLKTAKALGLTIPQSVMSRATRVIE